MLLNAGYSAFAEYDGESLKARSVVMRYRKNERDSASLNPAPFGYENSKSSEQQQNQQDNDDEAKSAAAIIAGAVERSAADAAEAPEQRDNENDQDDSSDRHVAFPPARQMGARCAASRKTHGHP